MRLSLHALGLMAASFFSAASLSAVEPPCESARNANTNDRVAPGGQAIVGSPVVRLLSSGFINGTPDTIVINDSIPQIVTYAFLSDAQLPAFYDLDGNDDTLPDGDLAAFDNAEVIGNIKAVFSQISAMTQIALSETTDVFAADIVFVVSTRGEYGIAYYPTGFDNNGNSASIANRAGDIHLNPAFINGGSEYDFTLGNGSLGQQTLMRLIGHALGMKRTQDLQPRPQLPFEDHAANSVMSCNTAGRTSATYMEWDIEWLRSSFGVKDVNVSNDVYRLTGAGSITHSATPSSPSLPAVDAGLPVRQVIIDEGGTDTWDLSGLPVSSRGYLVDLRPGGWTYDPNDFIEDELPAGFTSFISYQLSGVRISDGVLIENVVTSLSDDRITLNATANIISGFDPNRNTGNDVIINSDGTDTPRFNRV